MQDEQAADIVFHRRSLKQVVVARMSEPTCGLLDRFGRVRQLRSSEVGSGSLLTFGVRSRHFRFTSDRYQSLHRSEPTRRVRSGRLGRRKMIRNYL